MKNILFDKDRPAGAGTHAYQIQSERDQIWKETLIFPICKERWDDRLVYALLLETMQDPDSFKRVGLVELEWQPSLLSDMV